MIDENLPNFFLKPSADAIKYHHSFLFSQNGSEPEPVYDLHHLDPALPCSKNCYAVALFDSFNPEVLFGEVLIRPEWTQPTLSQDEIRRNGGVPPPPQPITPTDFTIQLYEPDQNVVVRQKPGSWGGSSTYEFSMPQQTFRMPSASAIDRRLNDPVTDATTPKLNFVWRKDGKLSKDMTCFMTGKSTDNHKKKNKEPDIAVALFGGLREVSIYEPNLYRVDMEDPKGLEVVLLLSAAVIRDIYFGQMKDVFNISSRRKNSGGILNRKGSSPVEPPPIIMTSIPQVSASAQRISQPVQTSQPYARAQRQSLPPISTNSYNRTQPAPITQVQPAASNPTFSSEDRRLRKLLEAEKQTAQKEARRKQTEVDRETERLKKIYGTQSQALPPRRPQPQPQPYSQPPPLLRPPQPVVPTQRHSAPLLQRPFRPSSQGPQIRINAPVPRPQPAGPYLHPYGQAQASASGFFGDQGTQTAKKKKSFWGLRSEGDSANKLAKKKSSLF